MTDTIDPGTPAISGSYTRQSVDDPHGIEVQHRGNHAYAAVHNLIIPEGDRFHFSDNATSGASDSRPDYDRLKAVVEAGAPFRYIVCRHLDRMGRWSSSPFRHFAELEWFFVRGITWVFTDDPITPTMREKSPALADVLVQHYAQRSVQARQEIKYFMERSRTRCTALAQAGFWVSAAHPYGTVRWLVDAETGAWLRPVPAGTPAHCRGAHIRLRWAEDGTKEMVRHMFTRALAGESTYKIARGLVEAGVPAAGTTLGFSNKRISRWTPDGIRSFLGNPIYCGVQVWANGGPGFRARREALVRRIAAGEESGGTNDPIVAGDAIEDPPVSIEMWLAVQDSIRGRATETGPRKRHSPRSFLSGLVRCGRCLRILNLQSSGGGPGHDRLYMYFQHDRDKMTRCVSCDGTGPLIRQEAIEAAITDEVCSYLAQHREIADAVLGALHHRLRTVVHEPERSRMKSLELERTQLREEATRLWVQLSRVDPGSVGAEAGHNLLSELNARAVTLDRRLGESRHAEERWTKARTALSLLVRPDGALGTLFREASTPVKRELMLAITESIRADLPVRSVEVRFRVFTPADLAHIQRLLPAAT